MLLTRAEAELVFKLHRALMQFVNDQLKTCTDAGLPESAANYSTLPAEKRYEVVKAFLGRRDLLDMFIGNNPAGLATEELNIVSSWRHLMAGRFIALRQLQKHMILLACDGSKAAYGVTGLTDPMQLVIPQPLPTMIETVLLPFDDKIVYDGIVSSFNVTFGPGSRRAFEDDYRIAKANHRVVTSLPWKAQVNAPTPNIPEREGTKGVRQPRAAIQDLLKQVMALTDGFCEQRLNEEYKELCRKLAMKLAAKRPTPLLSGRLDTWAVGIIRTIGWVNFLDDGTQSPHMKLSVIDQAFGVPESTGRAKAKAIRQMLKIHQWDYRWTLPSRWESTSMIWKLQNASGFIVDIRDQPVAMQRAAFRQGLIPYVPADRVAAAVQEQIAGSESRRLFQFKITLRGIDPPVWRRIQVWDDTVDKLHEHIQAAMGWTNSHLHEFIIQGRRCGDPELLNDDFDPFSGTDSTKTLLSSALAGKSAPFSFSYHYDFGDNWDHEVLWEGCPMPQARLIYPQCLEGERACPPEDVGGIHGYHKYLEAVTDPDHEQHQEKLDWNGPFDPGAFNPRLATHMMQEGVPDWRKMV